MLIEPTSCFSFICFCKQSCLSAAPPTSSGSWWFSSGERTFLTSSTSSSTSICSGTVWTPKTRGRGPAGTRTTPSPKRPSRYENTWFDHLHKADPLPVSPEIKSQVKFSQISKADEFIVISDLLPKCGPLPPGGPSRYYRWAAFF